MSSRPRPVACFLAVVVSCGAAALPPPPQDPPGARLPADFQRGVNHAHIHRRGHGYGSARSAEELAALRALGVNWIAITPFGYQDGATAEEIAGFPGREGPSEFFSRSDPSMTDTDIAREIAAAHALGMKVLLKPHIWSRDFWNAREWHGTIRQPAGTGHRRWWASYRAFVLHYARLAALAGADLYSVGNELVEMTRREDEWRALIADVRVMAPGVPLTYSAHWDEEDDRIGFWDALDFVGVNAYFPLDAPAGATVEQLVAAWAPHKARLGRLAARMGKGILFTEVGYRPVADAHREPWRYEGGTDDTGAQERAYEALFRAFAPESWWRGAYLWKTFTDPEAAARRGDAPGFSFRGRPAEEAVRRWYGGGHAKRPATWPQTRNSDRISNR